MCLRRALWVLLVGGVVLALGQARDAGGHVAATDEAGETLA